MRRSIRASQSRFNPLAHYLIVFNLGRFTLWFRQGLIIIVPSFGEIILTIQILILAAIAAFLVYRLYLVLGERNGSDQQNESGTFVRPKTDGTASARDYAAIGVPERAKPVDAVVIEPAAYEPGTVLSLDTGLKQIAAIDPNFNEKSFLQGARAAFELILKSYASGDLATLKPLLGDDLYHSFADDIRARQARGDTMDTTIYNIREADISQAQIDRVTANIGVRFVSEQNTIIRDASGNVTAGGDRQVISDHWLFARNTRNNDPNWQLVETLPE